ncbi:helix-turn-helix domain-containing protein [Algoriphagus faecimaris]|nr:helix-turn-helix domain-containing protein [Algoriphagus faecimaris]
MKKSEKKGLWIPIGILEDNNLDSAEKILLSEIYSLTELPEGCFASNDHFGTLLNITKGAASKRIKKLKEKGYINTKDVYEKKSCVGRIITKARKSKNENIETGKVLQEGNSLRKQTHVPNELEGSSFSTREVLPDQPDPSSQGKPINTNTNSDLLKQHNYNTGEIDSIIEDVVDSIGEEISSENQPNTQIAEEAGAIEADESISSTKRKKYSGVSQSGTMSMYKFASLQFENAKNFLTTSTILGSEIFDYADEKKYFLLKQKLKPEVYNEIVVPIKHYIQARKALGLDKK